LLIYLFASIFIAVGEDQTLLLYDRSAWKAKRSDRSVGRTER